jgi:1-acyl-sn-glycerol-3-phosphate acyltransferase
VSFARIFYRVAWLLLVSASRVYWRISVTGRQLLPPEGPFVLAPVHRSNIDFLVVAGLTRRRLRYMGKDSLWKVPVLRSVINALGAFPVRRGAADREALRLCLKVLEEGEPLVLFPEGTRRTGPRVNQLFEGAVYTAARARVPVVPVGIGGSEKAMPRGVKLPRPAKVRVVVGAPIAPPEVGDTGRVSRSAVRESTERLHEVLQLLFDEARIMASPG